MFYIDGLVQDCSNSSALAMELLQSCTKPSIYTLIALDERRNVISLSILNPREYTSDKLHIDSW